MSPALLLLLVLLLLLLVLLRCCVMAVTRSARLDAVMFALLSTVVSFTVDSLLQLRDNYGRPM